VLNVIKELSGKETFYDIIDSENVKQIWVRTKKLKENAKAHGVYAASLKNYCMFLEFLQLPRTNSLDITNNVASPEEPYAMSIPVKQTNRANVKPFSIQRIITLIDETGLLYSSKLVKRFAFSLMSKQFVILSGLAGSGKTQLALAFANMLIEDDSQMCVVPVGADWTNREPLLGFPNALQENVYVKPESGVLDLLIQANKTENADKPYFLILDEMNMSYVERYFADFLSAMESHKRIPLWCGDDGVTPTSIGLPQNLFIIGTINVDETTYMFSPKVLDRASVIEFKITGEEMSRFLSELKPIDRDAVNYAASDMGAAFVACAKNKTVAAGSSEIRDALIQFFDDLKAVNAEFGYRSATEIYRFISQAIENDDTEDKMSLSDIIDCAIVQKLLPKLHGSRKKLNDALSALWKECFDDAVDKQTLYITKENVDRAKFRLTADKIQRMYDAALANGFTSFAEA
jgi:5-methylcytosine-specific restriction protein B